MTLEHCCAERLPLGCLAVRALAAVTLGVVLVLLWALPARAESIVVAVDGNASPAERTSAGAAARSRLEEGGHDVRELDATHAATLVRCVRNEDRSCVVSSVTPLAADRVLVLEVNKDIDRPTEKSLVVTGWLIDGRTGTVVVSDRRFCERCTADSLGAITREFTETLLRDASARGGSTILAISSTPTGARVELDGSAIGVTDLEYGVYPGSHTITIDKPGFRPSVQAIVAEANQRTEVRAVLVPLDTPPPGRRPRFRAWKWTTLAAGVAALAVGTWLVIVDEPGEVDGHLRPRERNSFWPGVAIGAVGAASLGVSIYMFWSDARAGGAGSSASGAAAGQAFIVGIGGTF